MIQPLINNYSLVRGGPTHRIQSTLRLLSSDELPGLRCAAATAVLAWLPLAILALLDGRAWADEFGAGFASDISTHVRLLFGIFALVLIDRIADRRLMSLLDGFSRSGIIGSGQQQAFIETLAVADRRTSSSRAEAAMLLIAFLLTLISMKHIEALDGTYWVTTENGGLSPAGWWSMLVSSPIYFFLISRWLWRLGVWATLLRGISRLDLQLVPTHPDRCGGIGFLTLFPVIFTPLSLILSVIIAASCLREITFGSMTFEVLRAVWIGWTVLIVILFAGPLAFFSQKLFYLRETAVIDFSGVISRIKRDLEKEMMEHDGKCKKVSPETISAASDIDPSMSNVLEIKTIPVELWAITPLILSSLLPFVAVAATLIPLGDLFKRIAALLM